MSVFKNRLLPGEKLIFLKRQHPIVLFIPVLFSVITLVLLTGISIYTKRFWLLAFYLIPLICFLMEYVSWQKRLYILTDKRILKQEGILTVSMSEIPLNTIHRVFHRQSLPGRLFQYGKVGIETSNRQESTEFHFLTKPADFENHILSQRES